MTVLNAFLIGVLVGSSGFCLALLFCSLVVVLVTDDPSSERRTSPWTTVQEDSGR